MREPVWWSLCCGLDATASWATAKRRPPVSRMGGKRAYSADVLRILGDWPKTWCMVDADPAIVLWWSAVFGGWLGEVAERIRAYDLDGEELWRSIVYANGKDGADGPAAVPGDPVDRLAAWLIAQKGNFSAKPLTWNPMAFAGGQAWQGVAGYGHVSEAGKAMGYQDRVSAAAIAAAIRRSPSAKGWSTFADLNTWEPDFQSGDLVTIDPPYAGTTGYGEVLPRHRVVELAEMADAAGARVLVHEAEPIIGRPGSLAMASTGVRIARPEAWRAVELRKGERRQQDTWRKRGRNGAREVVTINFEPAGRLPEQVDIWPSREEICA